VKHVRPRPSIRRRLLIGLIVVGVSLWAGGLRLYSFPGESMAPAIAPGSLVVGLVGPWTALDLQRFEIVIFDVPPASKWAGKGIPWIKRVVGLPGERVELRGDELLINGQRIDHPYRHQPASAGSAPTFAVTLGPDDYYVIGDNIAHSFDDSRNFGPISRRLIRGRIAGVLGRNAPP
jgi:signal peptidase I